jgi:hypothetical protein
MKIRATMLATALLAGALALPAMAQEAKDAKQAKETKEKPAAASPAAKVTRAMRKLARFHHAELTPEKAKAALEIFLTLKKEYPPETFQMKTPGPMGAVEAMKASQKARAILELVKEKGFADIDDWARTFTSLGMALAHVRQSGDEDIQAKLRDLEQAPMPEEMKAKIRAMLQALIPPQRNVKVAQELLADPETKKMIEAIENDR